MNEYTKSIIFYIGAIIVVYMVVSMIHLDSHENIHKAIFESYGCDAEISYELNGLAVHGWTTSTCDANSEIFNLQH